MSNRFDETQKIKVNENQSAQERKKAQDLEIKRLEEASKKDKYSSLLTLQKSWEKFHKKVPPLQKLIEEQDAILKKLADNHIKIVETAKEIVFTAPETDTGLDSSPLSPGMIFHYLQRHLIKNGMTEFGVISNPHLAKSFKESMEEGLLWAGKLENKKGDQLYGTIQQREQQLASKRSAGQ